MPLPLHSACSTFANMNRMKKEAMKVIAANMPSEEIAGLEALFKVCGASMERTFQTGRSWNGGQFALDGSVRLPRCLVHCFR